MDLLPELRLRFSADAFRERAKEKGGEVAPSSSFWYDQFLHEFVERRCEGRDDILFFVQWEPIQEVETVKAMRRDARSIPRSSDSSILWEKTLYLNIILHEFEYHVSCGVVTLRSDSDSIEAVKMSVTQQVYPSPTERRMDKKGKGSGVIYPYIMFCVDNFEEVFSRIQVHSPGEKVAVQLLVSNKASAMNRIAFVGAVDYSTLKPALDRKQQAPVPVSERLKKLTAKRGRSAGQDYQLSKTFHFIRMRGPSRVGFAEVALGKLRSTDSDAVSVSVGQSLQPDLRNSGTGMRSDASGFDDMGDPRDSVEDDLPESLPGPVSSPRSKGSKYVVGGSPRREASSRDTSPLGTPTNSNRDSSGVADDHDMPASSEKDTVRRKFPSLPKLYRRRRSSEADVDSSGLFAYLTYIQLPWYTLFEDILNGTKAPIL